SAVDRRHHRRLPKARFYKRIEIIAIVIAADPKPDQQRERNQHKERANEHRHRAENAKFIEKWILRKHRRHHNIEREQHKPHNGELKIVREDNPSAGIFLHHSLLFQPRFDRELTFYDHYFTTHNVNSFLFFIKKSATI